MNFRAFQPNHLLNFANFLIAIAVGYIGLLSYQLANRSFQAGPTAARHLSATALGASDALKAIRDSSVFNLSLRIGDQEINRLYTSTAILENDGNSAITPQEIFEPITIKTVAPWKIIAVADQPNANVQFIWKRKNDQEFYADKALVNAGDRIWSTVYLTYESVSEPAGEQLLNVPLVYSARITNLKAIENHNLQDENHNLQNNTFIVRSSIIVGAWGWGIVVLIVMFCVYFSLYLIFLERLGLLMAHSFRTSNTLLIAAVVSVSSAEAGNAYLFGDSPFFYSINHWLNAPVLIINYVALASLFWLAYLRLPAPTSV